MSGVSRLILLTLVILLQEEGGIEAYTLTANYSGASFFNYWDFYNAPDPTHGYVYYTTREQAVAWKLVSTNNYGQVYIGSDDTTISSGSGRASVRIQTKASWNNGLFILDLEHMPAGCGTWPAWWLVGPNWPNSGEIDIIEGVNTNTADQTTLHTSQGCDQSGEGSPFTGHWGAGINGPATNCYVNAAGQYSNQGCGIINSDNQSYGSPFNSMGGGTYALEWTDNFIRAFFWRRGTEPYDVRVGKPDPNSWGKPYAFFTLGSACPKWHFKNLGMVINLTFCGDWAGNTFTQQCPNKGNCDAFVQNNPSAFREAYWLINSLTIYQ